MRYTKCENDVNSFRGNSVLYSANVYAQYACATCGGSGVITTYTTCPGCGGTGQITHYETCSACGGWGIATSSLI